MTFHRIARFAVIAAHVAACSAPSMNGDEDVPTPPIDVQAPPEDGPSTDSITPVDGGTSHDGGADATPGSDGSTAPAMPRPPAAPVAPMMPAATQLPALMCPMGWRAAPSRTTGAPDPLVDYSTCEPYATDDPMTCPVGQAHFVGTSGCQPIGDACTSDEWPAGIDTLSNVIFVNDNAVGVGLGSTRATAYRTINQAIARATAGSTIAVAKGSYDEVITVPNGVTVLGACAAETIVRPTSFGDRAAVSDGVIRAAVAASATVRNLTVNVAGTTLVGVSAYANRNLSVRGVAVINAYRVGLYALDGATLTAARVTVADTRPGMDGSDGGGFWNDHATMQISNAMVLRNRDAGVASFGGTLRMTDVAVLATQRRVSDGGQGVGVLGLEGARITVERSLVDGNDTTGVGGRDPMTVIELSNSVVRRTETAETPRDGFGLFIGPGADATVTRTTFDRNQSAAIIVAGASAHASLTDVAVTRTAPLADGAYGRGLDVELGASVTVDRAVFDRNRDNAVFVSDATTTLMASNVTAIATAPGRASVDGVGAVHVRNGGSATIAAATLVNNEEGAVHVAGASSTLTVSDLFARGTSAGASSLGNAIDVSDGASLTLTRAALAQSQHVAVFVNGSGAALTATDLRVSDTAASPSGERGWAVRVQDRGRATIERAAIEGSTEIGVFARDMGTTVRLIDASVSRTSAAADGSEGYGVLVFGGASLSAERASITEARAIGAVVSDTGSAATLTDVRIAQTQPSPDGTGGWGALVQRRATLAMTRVAVEDSRDVGVLAYDADLTARDVTILRVLARACLERSSCPAAASWESALGLVSVNASRVTADGLQIDGASRCGLLTTARPVGGAQASTMTLALDRTGIYRSGIGWCQQTAASAPSLYLDPSNRVSSQQTMFAPPALVMFL